MKLLLLVVVSIASTWALPRQSPIAFIEELTSNGRIVFGQPAELGQFPWQVSINFITAEGSFFCGGSLITRQWILTAGHCVQGAIEFHVGLGTIDSYPGSGVSMRTNKYISHMNYDPITLNYDIALIKLPEPAPVNDNIQVISLPVRGQRVGANELVTVSGWGKTSDGGTVSPTLNYVSLNTVTNEFCASVYGTATITDASLCAVGHPKNSPCSGDSGGPLVQYDSNGVPELVGVVSFVHASGCASGNPSGYIRTESFLDWIASNIEAYDS